MNSIAFKARYGPLALVAGASQGLGAAFAEQIAACGINLVLVARRATLLDSLAGRIKSAYNVDVRTLALDLAQDDAALKISEALSDVEVGLVVYNAALSVIGPFMDRPLEDHLAEIATNCRTPLSLAYEFGKPMRSRGRGGIILMSSLSALQGSAYISNYTATKAYSMILAEGLWEELRHNGVDVLACSAGAVSTPNYLGSLTAGKESNGAPSGAMTPEAVARETLAALGREGSFVPGFTNKVAAFMMRRVLPHGLAVRIMGQVMRRLYGNYARS
jgi:short-subunit dehydrogenase